MLNVEPPSSRLNLIVAGLLLSTCCAVLPAQTPAPRKTKLGNSWTLAWSDEFNAPAGTSPDPAKWTIETKGDNSNNELEVYTARPENVQQRDGNLVITARQEDATGSTGPLRHYTSARINTHGLFTQTYGRFEARIKLPLGKGIWPAFWLLGDNIGTVGWPKCGEIDMMENIGEPGLSHSTLHGPGYSGGKGITAKYPLPAGQSVNSDFHLYAVEWQPNDIKFFLDDHLVVERTPADLPAGAAWVFNHPFFIILNLAVGGEWPGNPDETTVFPQQMLVDYVRVYTRPPTQRSESVAR